MQHLSIPPTPADRIISRHAADHTNPLVQNCLRAATWAADSRVLGTAAAAAWIVSRAGDRRQRALADHFALTVAAAVLLPKAIKKVADRQRRDRCMVGPDRQGVKTSGKPQDSFPSGHSVHIGAVVQALALAYPDKAAAFYALGGAIAATRVAVLAHWMTDVLVGLALGAAVERGVRRLTM